VCSTSLLLVKLYLIFDSRIDLGSFILDLTVNPAYPSLGVMSFYIENNAAFENHECNVYFGVVQKNTADVNSKELRIEELW